MIVGARAGMLLDVEGTTSSVRFVYDVLFPYARKGLDQYLATAWDTPETARACELIAKDTGAASFAAWVGSAGADEQRAKVRAEVLRLMDGDVKATGLKELQGLIWKQGFESGELLAHVYPDVPPALVRWHDAGRDVRIFSSGSVAAQKLFFAHTEAGDLSRFFQGNYDTTTGPKRVADSYRAIAKAMQLPPENVLFLSDVVEELNAAREAGLGTGLAIRPGNAAVAAGHGHPEIRDFSEVR